MSSTAGKDTIYVDIDDEITAIIDKVRASDQKIVALVLPKRATVLQSIVNMKLLKRTADDAKRQLVLITTEASLLPLAGNVGLHVASTLQSKPAIPHAPTTPGDEPEDIDEPLDMADDEPAEDAFESAVAANAPIGTLAGDKATSTPQVDESFELDNSDGALGVAAAVKAKAKKAKKLKIPNFDSFRNRLLLGFGALVFLVVGWIFAFVVLPHATITIHTDTSTIPTNLAATIDAGAKALSPQQNIIPATQQTEQKTYTQQVPTTGTKNNGTKATGSVTMTACASSPAQLSTIPTGTGVTSNGLTYITQQDATFSFVGSCGSSFKFQASGIGITALNGGTNYNVSGATFAVSGHSNVSASGSASGGTDNIVKVVTQTDIDSAKSKIAASDSTAIKQDLKNGLQAKGLYAIDATFVTPDPQVTSGANVGDQTDTVTVTEIVTYSMLGVKKADLQTLVKNNVNSQLDKGKQVILDDGVDKAGFNIQSQNSPTNFTVAISVKSVAGPQIDTTGIKKQLAGKKSGDVKAALKAIPGVTGVDVKYGPFWVTITPKNADKITVQLDKSNSGQS